MNKITLRQFLWCGLVLICIASPLYVIRWKYFEVLPTTLLELFVWVLFVLWAFWRFKYLRSEKLPFSVFRITLPIIIASVLAVLFADDYVAAFGIARAYFWEPIIVAFILYDTLMQNKTPRIAGSALLTVLLLSGVWLAILGSLQSLFGLYIVTQHQIGRAHGVFNNGNALALYLGPFIALLMGMLYWDRHKKVAGLPSIILIGILLLLGFVLTKSAGGVLSLIGVIAVLFLSEFLYHYVKRDVITHIFRVIVVGSFVLSIVMLAVSSYIAPDTDNPWVRKGGTSEVRICAWDGTANLLRDSWLVGVGLSGYKEAYSQYYVTCDAEPLEYPHNFWMTVWAELGLVGVGGFIYLFWEFAKKLHRSRISYGIFLAFTYILLHGLVDVTYFKNDLSVVFWILIALGFLFESRKE